MQKKASGANKGYIWGWNMSSVDATMFFLLIFTLTHCRLSLYQASVGHCKLVANYCK